MLGLDLIDLLLHLSDLLIEVLGHSLLMVAEACNFTIAVIVKLYTLVDWHLWNCARVNSMLILFEELI